MYINVPHLINRRFIVITNYDITGPGGGGGGGELNGTKPTLTRTELTQRHIFFSHSGSYFLMKTLVAIGEKVPSMKINASLSPPVFVITGKSSMKN